MNEVGNPQANIKDNVSTLVDQGHQTVDAIKSRVSSASTQVKDTGSELLRDISQYVQAHPLKGIGIALGLGYLAMRIRTSPVMELAFLGAFGYGAHRVLRR